MQWYHLNNWIWIRIIDDTHMTSMKTVQVLRLPTLIVHLHPKFFHRFDLGRPISKNLPSPPPPQMITNQLKENIIQGWLLYVIRSFFQVSLCFQYQLINLGFSLPSFHLAEAWRSPFSLLYTLICAVIQNITKCLLFIIIHVFSARFAINLFYLHNLKI